MSRFIDARIEVVFGDDAQGRRAGPADAVLIETLAGDGAAEPPEGVAAIARFGAAAGARHAIGCACCAPRGAAAEALGRLFLARARGEVGWFRRVLALTATETGRAAVRDAVTEDRLAAARFRLG